MFVEQRLKPFDKLQSNLSKQPDDVIWRTVLIISFSSF